MKTKNLVFVVLILLFTYQNCSQKNFNESALQKSQSVSDMQIQQFKFFTEDNKTYSLQTEAGVLTERSEGSDTFHNYCLTADLFLEIQSILSAATICESQAQLPNDVVCAQVIEPGYAQIVGASEVIQLGYAIDSCGTGRVDLCENQPQALKQWIQSVREQLPDLHCQ